MGIGCHMWVQEDAVGVQRMARILTEVHLLGASVLWALSIMHTL